MTPSCPARRSPFASRSLAEHLARGGLAVALALAALRFADVSAFVVPAALVGAVVLMRGCPTCWLVGLFGTMADRAAARAAAGPAEPRSPAGIAAPAE